MYRASAKGVEVDGSFFIPMRADFLGLSGNVADGEPAHRRGTLSALNFENLRLILVLLGINLQVRLAIGFFVENFFEQRLFNAEDFSNHGRADDLVGVPFVLILVQADGFERFHSLARKVGTLSCFWSGCS